MNGLIPNRSLLDIEFPLQYRANLPEPTGDVSGWRRKELLPQLGELDGLPEFGRVWACWNETGIAVACWVGGKSQPLRCDPRNYWSGDNLRICIDTRPSRDNRRATRFCHQFYFLPTGGGSQGSEPCAGLGKFRGGREDSSGGNRAGAIVGAKVEQNGYGLEGIIPASCLHGFDPEEHRRIGFYFTLEDSELGQQYLTVGDDLLWYSDPSTWAIAELQRDQTALRGDAES